MDVFSVVFWQVVISIVALALVGAEATLSGSLRPASRGLLRGSLINLALATVMGGYLYFRDQQCFSPNDHPGCGSSACETIVDMIDSPSSGPHYCLTEKWDQSCANAAKANCFFRL